MPFCFGNIFTYIYNFDMDLLRSNKTGRYKEKNIKPKIPKVRFSPIVTVEKSTCVLIKHPSFRNKNDDVKTVLFVHPSKWETFEVIFVENDDYLNSHHEKKITKEKYETVDV